jgi:hypothetical protein
MKRTVEYTVFSAVTRRALRIVKCLPVDLPRNTRDGEILIEGRLDMNSTELDDNLQPVTRGAGRQGMELPEYRLTMNSFEIRRARAQRQFVSGDETALARLLEINQEAEIFRARFDMPIKEPDQDAASSVRPSR